jgi:hypothetical protein
VLFDQLKLFDVEFLYKNSPELRLNGTKSDISPIRAAVSPIERCTAVEKVAASTINPVAARTNASKRCR